MYARYYELAREPFNVTPDPENLFLSPTHREALAGLIYGVERRKGFITITGEVGLGKTTILRAFLEQVDRKQTHVIYLFNPQIDREELLSVLFQELDLGEVPKNSAQATRLLYQHLIETYRENCTLVLVVDEAQRMPPATLEAIRLLSNLETTNEKLMQIVLAGQPELDEILQSQQLRQLNQRITIRVRLRPLDRTESLAYLSHRLAAVKLGDKPVITERALDAIASASGGVPRLLNVLADNAFLTGFGYGKRPVDLSIVREVIADHKSVLPSSSRESASPANRARQRTVAVVIAASVLLAGGAVALSALNWRLDTIEEWLSEPWSLDADRTAATSTNIVPLTATVSKDISHPLDDIDVPDEDAQDSLERPLAGSMSTTPLEGIATKASTPNETVRDDTSRTAVEVKILSPGSGEDLAATEVGPPPPAIPLKETAATHTTSVKPTAFRSEVVKPGDSLWIMIARVYGEATPRRLRAVIDVNPAIADFNTITPGQRIRFPIEAPFNKTQVQEAMQ